MLVHPAPCTLWLQLGRQNAAVRIGSVLPDLICNAVLLQAWPDQVALMHLQCEPQTGFG